MPQNGQLSFRTLLALLAIGSLASATQAQSTLPRVVSRFGLHRPSQTARLTLPGSKAQALPQTSANFSFGWIEFPGSPDAMANGLNSHGDVVGLYGPNLPAWDGTEQTYLLHNNTFQELSYPGAPYTGALGINKSREIVGWYADPAQNGIFHAFLRKGKVYTNIDVPGAQYSVAMNINDSGEVIGEYWSDSVPAVYGFALIKGVYTTIAVPNAVYTEALGINSAGVIVGVYYNSDEISHGFIYQKGQYTTVDYPGASNTQLTSINDQGQVLGGYGDDVIIGSEDWGTPNAFLLDQGNFTPFAPPVGDVQVTSTYAMSGSNFVGMYVDSLGNVYGFKAQIGGAKR